MLLGFDLSLFTVLSLNIFYMNSVRSDYNQHDKFYSTVVELFMVWLLNIISNVVVFVMWGYLLR